MACAQGPSGGVAGWRCRLAGRLGLGGPAGGRAGETEAAGSPGSRPPGGGARHRLAASSPDAGWVLQGGCHEPPGDDSPCNPPGRHLAPALLPPEQGFGVCHPGSFLFHHESPEHCQDVGRGGICCIRGVAQSCWHTEARGKCLWRERTPQRHSLGHQLGANTRTPQGRRGQGGGGTLMRPGRVVRPGWASFVSLFNNFIYLFLESGGVREKGRERKVN